MVEGARVRLRGWQQAAVALGSAVGALVDPRRADLIAALVETTGKPAFERCVTARFQGESEKLGDDRSEMIWEPPTCALVCRNMINSRSLLMIKARELFLLIPIPNRVLASKALLMEFLAAKKKSKQLTGATSSGSQLCLVIALNGANIRRFVGQPFLSGGSYGVVEVVADTARPIENHSSTLFVNL
ncbi:hypothetical protein M8C21_015734 [Ambrosia artemisiifolia]|uniref:Uncharacterized protein n=1 Tax=Ambrosia artemisiifolia TaxID=4212 RepID=A0AAD5CFD6_AMBAR|nr:hypothetical protein M8C21_015734 [Ambrosia artemisiifolia]